MPLSELVKLPLRNNQPIITANLLTKPRNVAGTTPGVPYTGNELDGGPITGGPITTVLDDGQSSTSISSGSRKGSRMKQYG